MPAGDKLIKEFGRLLKAYNRAKKAKVFKPRADAKRALFRHNEKIAKYRKGLTDPTEKAAFFMKQVEVEELARPVTSMKRLKNVREFLGKVEGGAKLEGGTLRTPAKFPWEMPKKATPINMARRKKEADRMQKVMDDAKIGAAHYESPSTKHLRKTFERDVKRAGGRITKFKPGDEVTVRPLMWQGEAYMPGIPEGWMNRYLHYFGKEKPTAAQLEKATKGVPRQLREDFGADVAKEYKAAHAYFSQEEGAFEGIWKGLAISGEKIRKSGKSPEKFRHLKRVKSVLPMTTGGIGGAGLARPKVPRVRAEEKGGEIPDEMPETGADIRGAIRGLFPKLSPEMQERLRHTRMPMSQFTQAEIETPGGTITPERMQIAPESFLLMPGITAEKVLKRLAWNPVSGEVLSGGRLAKVKQAIERFPKDILDYVKDVRYMSPRHMRQFVKDEGRQSFRTLGALWEPKFTRGASPYVLNKPGSVLINPRSQAASTSLDRLLAHEVGHGGEEAIRRSVVRGQRGWQTPERLETVRRLNVAGLLEDYPMNEEMFYSMVPHEQWARAFDEYITTGKKMFRPHPLSFRGEPSPPMKMRALVRRAMGEIEKYGIP